MPLTVFDWGHLPGTDVQIAQWGRYVVFLRRRSTGAWSIELWHETKRIRHAEHPGDLTPAEARAIAEGFLLDVQGPRQRELVRRMRAASATTRSLRAGGKRRRAGKGVVVNEYKRRWPDVHPSKSSSRWQHVKGQPGISAAYSYRGDYQVSHRPGFGSQSESHTLSYRPSGEHHHIGTFPTAKQAYAAAHAHELRLHKGGGKKRHAAPSAARPSRLGALVADINRLTR